MLSLLDCIAAILGGACFAILLYRANRFQLYTGIKRPERERRSEDWHEAMQLNAAAEMVRAGMLWESVRRLLPRGAFSALVAVGGTSLISDDLFIKAAIPCALGAFVPWMCVWCVAFEIKKQGIESTDSEWMAKKLREVNSTVLKASTMAGTVFTGLALVAILVAHLGTLWYVLVLVAFSIVDALALLVIYANEVMSL